MNARLLWRLVYHFSILLCHTFIEVCAILHCIDTMLCYAMPYHATLCHVPHQFMILALPCYAIPYYTITLTDTAAVALLLCLVLLCLSNTTTMMMTIPNGKQAMICQTTLHSVE